MGVARSSLTGVGGGLAPIWNARDGTVVMRGLPNIVVWLAGTRSSNCGSGGPKAGLLPPCPCGLSLHTRLLVCVRLRSRCSLSSCGLLLLAHTGGLGDHRRYFRMSHSLRHLTWRSALLFPM
mmetsp:Transcript_576/g.1937  ORF Transcript_576/g.1937 Transcript_576/m.1937 type:complete len:122 (+) Transcript_576:352-717(+)